MLPTGPIHSKLTEIYDDFAANVTHIYGRHDLHLAIDLVYHSPISFIFDGRPVEKGYPEILILGDTRTGKSQCAKAMLHHYGCGALAQAESMSYAGLVGGCQKMFEANWDITWGKLPQNNRRLVIIDEVSAMHEKDLIGKLSDIRSSGVATIEKMAAQKTEAKTRIIWIGNPRGRFTVGQYSSGINVIESLCSQPEDIARWDMALIVAKDDIDLTNLRKTRTRPEHRFTNAICRNLILWTWSRKQREVKFSPVAEDACFTLGYKLWKKYEGEFTLVVEAEQPLKLARLSAGLAGRLFSTKDGVNLLVEPEHVEYIYHFMQHIYDGKNFGYDAWSQNRTEGQAIVDRDEVENIMVRFERGGCSKFLRLDKIKLKDIEELLGIPADEAKPILSCLINNNALERQYNEYYHKSKEFNQMLRDYVMGKSKGNGKPQKIKDDL